MLFVKVFDMSVKIKLCGIKRSCDIDMVNKLKPNYIGMVFVEKSKRYVTYEESIALSSRLDDGIIPVGVFVNMPLDNIAKYKDSIKVFQLHGDEDDNYIVSLRSMIPDDCEIWKAVRVKSFDDIKKADDTHADKLLLDAFSSDEYGGTGKRFDIGLIKEKPTKPFFIAGGVSEDNIAEIFEQVKSFSPYGFDVSSSIETNGVKDEIKAEKLMLKVKSLI